MKRFEFTLNIKKFIDAPFSLGDKSKGWDCLNSLDEFYRSIGKNFPQEYRGINADNYAEKWRLGEAKQIFREFLLSLGCSVNRNYALEGDLFVFDGEETAFPGIYLGRGHVLMVFDKGVKVLPLNLVKKIFKIVDVRRLE